MTEAKRRRLIEQRRAREHGPRWWLLSDYTAAEYIQLLRRLSAVRLRYLHHEAAVGSRRDQVELSRLIAMERSNYDQLLRYDLRTGVYDMSANPRGSHTHVDAL